MGEGQHILGLLGWPKATRVWRQKQQAGSQLRPPSQGRSQAQPLGHPPPPAGSPAFDRPAHGSGQEAGSQPPALFRKLGPALPGLGDRDF